MTASHEVLGSARGAPGRVPDFFIVGHPKSGTSAMYKMLRDRPQIYMPYKEPSYFVPEISRHRRYSGGLQDYRKLYAGAEPQQRVGEATTSYLWSRDAARRIAEVQPDARIVAILREPASFLRSLHLQFIKSNIETEADLRRALELEGLRQEGKALPRHSARPLALVYSEHLRYAEQLRRYHAVFPSEQVLVLIYEEFRADNVATMQKVLRFLDVDDGAPVEPIEANPAVRVRSPRAYELVRSVYRGRGAVSGPVKGTIKALTPQKLRHKAVTLTSRSQLASPRPADEQLMRELRQRFKTEVVAAGEYLGRDLVHLWGYDDLD
jgi:hypothetical protein